MPDTIAEPMQLRYDEEGYPIPPTEEELAAQVEAFRIERAEVDALYAAQRASRARAIQRLRAIRQATRAKRRVRWLSGFFSTLVRSGWLTRTARSRKSTSS